jgi:hypothetical protein
MDLSSAPKYVCGNGGYFVGGVAAAECRAYNGAPSQPGYHPGIFIVEMSGQSGGVLQCNNGVTVSYAPDMLVNADGNYTIIQ